MSFSVRTSSFFLWDKDSVEFFELFGNYKYRGTSACSGLPFVLRKRKYFILDFGLDHAAL